MTYATARGHALIGRALYLPEGCAADEEHREPAGVPEEVMFATKPQLASGLLETVPVANWMHVENGKITRIRVAFDARGIAQGS